MRKFLLSLTMLMAGAMSVWAQVTDVSQLNNESAYTIKSVNRGFLYYDANNADYVTSSSHTEIVNVAPTGLPNEQFAFLRTVNTDEGHYYLYSIGASKFVTYTGKNGVKLELTDVPQCTWTLSMNDGCFVIKVPKTTNTCINITNWQAHQGCKVIGTNPDDGNRMTITSVATEFTLTDAIINAIEKFETVPATEGYIIAAKANIKVGIGYPKTSSEAYIALNDLDVTDNKTEAEIDELVEAYLACSDVMMPEDGKAYTIKAKYDNSTVPFRYIYTNIENNKIQTHANPSALPAPHTSDCTTFICRALETEGEYAFVNYRGEYLVFYADGKKGAGNTNDGLADTYVQQEGDKDAVIKLVPAAESTKFGCFIMQAWNSTDRAMFNFMAGEPDFHNAGATDKFFTSNRSSFFIFEEVEYANTPELKSVGESELMSKDLHNKALATFSAPFATVVPEGVKAYTATAYEGGVSLTAIEGAIPANTGVVLERETAGTVTMKPVTSENVAEVTENAFGHSAGAAKSDFSAGCYVLSAVNGVAGFYKINGGTLAMNKAYLEISSDAQAIRVTRGSEEGTTGIENAEVKVQDAAIVFDLMGRRVETMIEGNIYIVNGKKIIR